MDYRLVLVILSLFFAIFPIVFFVSSKSEKAIKIVFLILTFLYSIVVCIGVFTDIELGRTITISTFENVSNIKKSFNFTIFETINTDFLINILMFVPLGFWLPVGKERFRVFWKTYLVGFLLTVGIESLQLILSLGLFEVADLFNNTMGTMIGYGLYKIVEYVVLLFKKEKPKFSRMIVGQIPLVLAVCMFTGIFWAYEKQELGNLSIECISPYPEGTFEIVTNAEYSEEIKTAVVYQTNTLTVEECESFTRNFFENLGSRLDESRIDIYENTAIYWSEDGHQITISYKGCTYDLKDFNILFPEEG